MDASRGRPATRRRVWGTAVAAVVGGAALYVVLAYRVLQAGGFTLTSARATCAEAATGRASTSYRLSEDVEIERTFLPLGATCRWSGGSSAALMDVGWASWIGPVLVLGGVAVLVGLSLTDRH